MGDVLHISGLLRPRHSLGETAADLGFYPGKETRLTQRPAGAFVASQGRQILFLQGAWEEGFPVHRHIQERCHLYQLDIRVLLAGYLTQAGRCLNLCSTVVGIGTACLQALWEG